MEDILDRLIGVDKKNEIFNLWFEINFLRHCFNSILSLNPELQKDFDERWIERCREMASEEVKNRFPHCKIDFLKPLTADQRKENKNREIDDLLTTMEKVLSANVDQKEDPFCTPEVPQELPSSFQNPSNAP